MIAPPSAAGSPWVRKFEPASEALASGWMRVRGARRRKAVDRGFVLSDHADWPGLLTAVRESGATRVLVTHGFAAVLARHLRERGLDAGVIATRYGDEEEGADPRRGGGAVKAFADLYAALDETTRTTDKVAAMARYFAAAPPADAAWAVYFLSGRKPRQAVPSKRLRLWARELAGVPEWLFDECYHAVGDLAETIALLLPPAAAASDRPLADWVENHLLPLRGLDEERQKADVLAAWASARRPAAVRLEQADHRRVPRRRVAAARRPRPGRGLRAADATRSRTGSWAPGSRRRLFYAALVAPDAGDADVSRPVPVLPRPPAGGRAGRARAGRASGRPSGSGTASARR